MLANSYLTCEWLANVLLVTVNQSKRAPRSVHVICVTLNKMADRREDERVIFQFIDEVCFFRSVDISSAGYNDTKNKQKLLDERVVRYTGQISTDIRFRPNLNNIP